MIATAVARRLRALDGVTLWKALAAIGAITSLSFAWFLHARFRTLAGDDLYIDYGAHHGGYASSLTSFGQAAADKYRPVLTPVLYSLTHLFGGSYPAYRDVNLTLQILNVCLLGLLVYRLTRGRWLITVGAMVVMAVSRFNAYYVLQGQGVMEGLALAFMLGVLIAVERAWCRRRPVPLLAANLCLLCAVFTHERYLTLIPYLVVATLIGPVRFGSRWSRAAWSSLPVGTGLLNYLVKVDVIHIPFFTGGGGQALHPSLPVITGFMKDGLLTLLGYNEGPAYLSGQDVHLLGTVGVLVAAGLAIPVVLALGSVVVSDVVHLSRDPSRLRKYAVAVTLFVPLLLSASITFRQEYRWLYEPFIVLVIGVCWALASSRARPRFAVAIACLFVVGSLTVDGFYRQYISNTYFFAAQSRADSVREQLVDHRRELLSSTTVVFIGTADPSFRDFDIGDGRLFDIYAPEAIMDVRYVADMSGACASATPRRLRVVLRVRERDVVDVTGQADAECASLPAHA